MNKRPIYLFSIASHPEAISINSLEINFLKPDINFSQYDYFIVTSKQASKALEQYDKNAYITTAALCVSTQSAKSFEALGGKVLTIGEGYGDNLVEKIKSYPKSKKWLYLRAKTVVSDFVTLCQNEGYSIDEKIVYESSCSKDIFNVEVEKNAILIFTSPSSVECFLKNHILTQKQTIIVIGKTTAKAIPAGIKSILSTKTTIDSCIEIAKEHISYSL
jgi:uroporphyrinogen-III synthase